MVYSGKTRRIKSPGSGLGGFSTTLTINETQKNIWSREVLSLLEIYQSSNDSLKHEDNACLNFVNGCLNQLYTTIEEYRHGLRIKTSSLSDYTPCTEYIIEKFIRRGIVTLHLEIDCQKALIRYDHIDEILQRQYLVEKPTDQLIQLVERLCHMKTNLEKTKHELNLLKNNAFVHLSFHPFDHQSIVEIPQINCIEQPSLQEQLYEQYKIIVEHTKHNTYSNYISSIEKQISFYEKQFHNGKNELWKISRALRTNDNFSSFMLHLIDQRLANINASMECINKYKTELFHTNSTHYVHQLH
ncbi:hypothetical protein I4U23_010838 [Adineta vaga]|nr:hypothetical protein I4U23_010838 [Adineta vaga]